MGMSLMSIACAMAAKFRLTISVPVYNAASKLLGTTTHTDYGYYKNPKHLGEQQQVPAQAAQLRQ